MFVARSGQMNKLYKGTNIDGSFQARFHLAKWFQRKRVLKTQSTRIKNCQWQPCLLSDPDDMNKLHKESPIEASCIVWFHLSKWFQRRFLKTQQTRIKNDSWWLCLLCDREEMNKLYDGAYIAVSFRIWFDLAKWFQVLKGKIFKISANQN